MSLYFDHAAATPLDERVLAVMLPFFSEQFYNPSALYDAARQTSKALQQARVDVAAVLGARPSEIVFTAGGTESTNLAINGIMLRYPNANLVVSAVEHEAVLLPAQQYTNHIVPVKEDGVVDVEQLRSKIDDQTVLISIMYANNEIGSVQPIARISKLIKEIRSKRRAQGNELPLYFHTDACQIAGYLDVHVARLGVDLLTLNGGKMYGPKQSGILYVKGGILLDPLLRGGGQERGLRSGTENVAACIGFAEALRIADSERQAETKRLLELREQFIKRALQQIPNLQINGSQKHRLPGNVHVTVPGSDNERLLILLDAAGIQAAAGSACSASHDVPSHVLRAIGLSDEQAQASLRFSMGRSTTSEAVTTTVETLARLVA